MFDFQDIFKEQLATEKPLTAGAVNGILSLLAYNKTPREIMQESKKLKAKIGKKRLLYYVTHANADGTPKKEKMEKVFEDDLDELQTLLADYNFMGHSGVTPKFASKNIK